MDTLDGGRLLMDSEIAMSCAYGGVATRYPGFTHVYNPHVPWCGDYNRALDVDANDPEAFFEIVERVEDIHAKNGLERPDRYGLRSPVDDEDAWREQLAERGFRIGSGLAFWSPTKGITLDPAYTVRIPGDDEYIDWHHKRVAERSWYDDEWYAEMKPCQAAFVKVFRPYWFERDGEFLGWVYCGKFSNSGRLFEVELLEQFRGQGIGRSIMDAVRQEAARAGIDRIILSTGEERRRFYESAGFRECTRKSVIRLRT